MTKHNIIGKVAAAPPLAPKRLLDQVRECIGDLHYSPETEKTCATPRANSPAIATALV